MIKAFGETAKELASKITNQFLAALVLLVLILAGFAN